MRSCNNLFRGAFALGLTGALAGCGLMGGEGERPLALSADPTPGEARTGPAADYPMVLGEPFSIDGVEHVPSDALNHDEVGYASLDAEAGAGVTAAHKTLPLPSYVEITSLQSGRTILARVERRGPMTNSRVVALSPDALAQLSVAEGAPVRVRRVNPPEAQRAELRAGQTAPLRMDTPETLLGVLRRRLPADGSASLADARQVPVPSGVETASASATGTPPPVPAAPAKSDTTPATPAGVYALAPISAAEQAKEDPPSPATPTPAPPPAKGEFVVQAAAFSSEQNAVRAAEALEGFVTRSGAYYRVRTGPYETRGQAEAALAKVRAAGYSDAKVSTQG